MPTVTINVFPGMDRPAKITVKQDGVPVEFVTGGVSKMILQFEESDIVADSSVDPTLITWNDLGEVVFNIGELGLPIGNYIGTLIAFDPAHTNGQPVVSEADGNILQFVVVGDPVIAIIVEDGSNVPNANSYDSIESIRAYAIARGYSLPVDDSQVAAMIMQGMDYIEAKACAFQGEPANEDQALSWPREYVTINCKPVADDAIPKQLKAALAQLVIAVSSGVKIFPNFQLSDYMNFVIEKTVGPLTRKYADPSKLIGASIKPQLTAVDAMLAPLFGTCNDGFFKTRRV